MRICSLLCGVLCVLTRIVVRIVQIRDMFYLTQRKKNMLILIEFVPGMLAILVMSIIHTMFMLGHH